MSEQTEWTGQMLEAERAERPDNTAIIAEWALANAASRIADALEKISAPTDPKPLIAKERELCACLADIASQIEWNSAKAALKDVAQAIRNRTHHEEAWDV